MSRYYVSKRQEQAARIARHYIKKGYDSVEDVVHCLDQEGYPNQYVLVQALFDQQQVKRTHTRKER